MKPLAVSVPLVLLSGALASQTGSSWPQWDGPHFDGRSHETDWSSAPVRDEHLWELEVGLGYSAVVVHDGKLYTMGYDVDAALDLVWCLDAQTGEELWVHTYPAAIWNQAHEGGSVNTPSIADGVVYTLNREGNAYALDAETGEELWHRDLNEEHGLTSPTWGYSGSPLVLADQLVLNCNKVVGLDRKTGDLLWASKDYGHAYCTPVALDVEGTPAVTVLNGEGVALVSRKDGSELAFHPFGGSQRGVNAATPILIAEDALFVSSSVKPGGALLAIAGDELIPVWENREMANTLSGCVRMGDHLYGFDGQTLKCIDLEGHTLWEERGVGNGAIMGAGDRLVAMNGSGELVVARATPEKYEELSKTPLFDQGRFWTKPILVDGVIYCRSSKGTLVARDHRAPKKEG